MSYVNHRVNKHVEEEGGEREKRVDTHEMVATTPSNAVLCVYIYL